MDKTWVEQVEKVHVYTLASGRVVSKLLPKAVLSNDHPAPPLRCAYVIDEDNVTRCLLKNYALASTKLEKNEQIHEHKKSKRKCKSKRMAIRRFFQAKARAKASADVTGSNFKDERRKLAKRDCEIRKKEKDPKNYPVANNLNPDFVRGITCSHCERFLVTSTMMCQHNHPICLTCAEQSHYTSSFSPPKCDDISNYKCILCHGPLAITDEFTEIMKLCRFRCTEEACEQKNDIFNYEDFVQHTQECKLKFHTLVSSKK